ncbi:retrovirus-related pol polyprotein from transposon TNT 1-94 [Tanacetum coccineum]
MLRSQGFTMWKDLDNTYSSLGNSVIQTLKLLFVNTPASFRPSPICLLSKASKTKSWLWNRCLSHLNFGAINHLARHGLVRGLPKLKFEKDHLLLVLCEKARRNPTNLNLKTPTKKNSISCTCIIVDQCVLSKDEAPDFIIKFLKMIQVWLKVPVQRIRTDNGTKFVNQTLREYYEKVGISFEIAVARSPHQNSVVERRNHTLIKAARIMLIYAKAQLFLWAEAVATACYTKNCSIIRLRHDKTPYELLHDKLPDLSFFYIISALCYLTNDNKNLGKLQPKADIDFDKLTVMAFEHSSLEPALHEMTPFDELLNPPTSVDCPAPEVIALINEVDHPLDNIIGELERLVSTRLQLHEQALFYYYDAFLISVEPKSYQDALTQACWIKAMQEELNEFKHLDVWELVPHPDKVIVITLKWIYKVKLDELGGILKNKARLQSDWLADTDKEIDEQELEAHYSYMAKIQEVPNADSGTDAEPLEQVQYDNDDNVFANDIQHFEQSESITNTCAVKMGDSNVIPDSPDMCDNDIQDDQNDVECDDEHVALANLKLDVDENKKIQKQLKKANATLTKELTKCKSILAETSRTLRESNSIWDSCLVALQINRLSLRGVAHRTNVSRPQPRSNQMKDRDLVQGNITINMVYYVEGLNHNLFSVGQFCDADLEVAFRKSTCFVRDLQGNDLLTGNRGTDLYTISHQESTSSTPICLMAKASPTQAWLWHRRLSHLNFDYINLLLKKDVVIGLPKLKYVKDQLYTTVPSQQELDLLFGPLYDEFFNDGTSCVNKSSSPTDNSIQKDTLPSTHIQPTSETTTPTNVHAEENNDNQAEFTNPFCTPV